MRLPASLMRFVFYHLYHTFAWAYDVVADIVSLGQWKNWIYSVLPHLEGPCVLELGHGPGHLQRSLLEHGMFAVGLDESAPMGYLAYRRLKALTLPLNLVRSLAQALPFSTASFNTVVATFPSDYILDPHTLAEVHRVLKGSGRLIVLLTVQFSSSHPLQRFLQWLYWFTRQTLPTSPEILPQQLLKKFTEIGFHLEIHTIPHQNALLTLLVATPLPSLKGHPYAFQNSLETA